MARRSQRTARRQSRDQPAPTTVAPISGPQAPSFAYVISGIFLIVAAVGILRHEMWRDEYQAWLVTRDAHSLVDLFHNLKYEGNPALWHLLLFPLTAMTHDARAMQALNLVIAVAFVFVLNRYAPFPASWKVLFTFGYYALFEFALISRTYGLGLLLALIVCALFHRRHERLVWIALVLAALANTTVFGFLICLAFAGVIGIEYVAAARLGRPGRAPARAFTAFLIIVATGAALAAWQIYPAPDNTFPVSYPAGPFERLRLDYAVSRILTSYWALPRLDQPHFWNTNILEGVSPGHGDLPWLATNPWLAWLTIGLFGLYLLRRPLSLLFYLGGTTALTWLFYYTGFTQQRYTSHFFVVLLCAMWLSADPTIPPVARAAMRRLSSRASTAGYWLFSAILAVSCVGGIGAYYQDFVRPFSASGEVARLLVQQKLDQDDIVGVTDFTASPVAARLDRQIYYPQRHGNGSFVIWDGHRIDPIFYPQIIEQVADRMRHSTRRRLVLLLDLPMPSMDSTTNVSSPFVKGLLTKDLFLERIGVVPPGIVEDETYYVYLITPAPSGGK